MATGRDRLRELLDAVLDTEHGSLDDMSAAAHASPFHFSRQLSRHTGESPVAMRRRVELERAAWHLQRGWSVTDAALDAGYDSVEGFTRAFGRAFGHPPSHVAGAAARGHWLPAPNGIHFHSPTALYVEGDQQTEHEAGDVVALLVRHDVDDTAALLDVIATVPEAASRARRLAGGMPLAWAGPEESLAEVARHLALSKLPWLRSIAGDDQPDLDEVVGGPDDPPSLAHLHAEVGAQWLALVRDVDRRGAWSDSVVDALCDPPETFVLSQIVAHELTFGAHRRQVARWMLRDAGIDTSGLDPDPIMWHRRHTGGAS